MKNKLYINNRGKLVEDVKLFVETRDRVFTSVWLSEILVTPCTIPLSSLGDYE